MKKSSLLISIAILLLWFFSFATDADNCSLPIGEKDGVMEVTKLVVKGKELSNKESVIVPMVPPGAKNTENCPVTLGQSFLSGTEITAPTRTTITLKSINGSEIDLDPGCRLVIDTINNEGESYIVREGKVWFDVVKNLSFFHVDYQGRFVALVKGTRFSMDVQPNKQIQFEVEMGRVEIVRSGKIRIEEGNKDVANVQEVETIDSETNSFVSYPLDAIEYLKQFKTYKYAENYYREQLELALKTGEYDRIQISRMNLGGILITLGRPGEALPYFEQGLKDSDAKAKELEPRIPSVEAAKILAGTEKPVEDAWRPSLLTMLGLTYASLGNYREGITYASKAYNSYTSVHPRQEDQYAPFMASIDLILGLGYGGLGEFHKSIDYMERAIALDSRSDVNNTDSLTVEYTLVALAYNELGYHQRSIETMEKSAAFSQNPLVAITNNIFLSRAYIGLGDYHRAIAIAEKVRVLLKEIGLDQNDALNSEYYLNLSYAQLGLGDYKLAQQYAKKSLEFIEQYLKGNPIPEDFAEAYDILGRAYLGLGKSQEAIQQLKESLRIQLKNHADERYPKLMQTYNALCEVYLHLRNYQEAISICNRALISVYAKFTPDDIDPKVSAASYSNLGKAYLGLHDYTHSIELFQKAAAILEKYLQAIGKNAKTEQRLAEVYGSFARAELFAGNPLDAIKSADKGLQVDPSQIWIEANLAHGYLLSNQFDRSKQIYLENKNTKIDKTRSFKDLVLNDFKSFRERGIHHPDMEKIEQLLRHNSSVKKQ